MRRLHLLLTMTLLIGSLALMQIPYGCGPAGGGNGGGGDNKKQDCTAPDFPGCDAGNKCDTTKKVCVCDKEACSKLDNSGCHPVTNSCETHCTDDSQCTDGNKKCVGPEGNKFCQDPTKDQCAKDEDCTDPKFPVCDTTKSPKVCIAKSGCKKDDDCIDDPDKPVCDDASGQCVECKVDDDCIEGKKCNTQTFTCEGPAGCTDTKTCHDQDPKTYCDEEKKDAGCQTANATCTADHKVTKENNSGWDGKNGPTIWGVKANRVTADKCWHYVKDDTGAKVDCVDDSDCEGLPSKAKCFELGSDKWCGAANKNGMVEVSFKFYSEAGLDTCFKCAITHAKSGLPTDQLSITSGDKNSGTAKFGICIDKGGSYQFMVKDKKGGLSNAGCYSVSGR